MPAIISSTQTEYLKKLRIKPVPLIAEMEEFAKKHKVPILNWNAAEFLEQLVLMQKPKRVLELVSQQQ